MNNLFMLILMTICILVNLLKVGDVGDVTLGISLGTLICCWFDEILSYLNLKVPWESRKIKIIKWDKTDE